VRSQISTFITSTASRSTSRTARSTAGITTPHGTSSYVGAFQLDDRPMRLRDGLALLDGVGVESEYVRRRSRLDALRRPGLW
jgi:hypothetical protein